MSMCDVCYEDVDDGVSCARCVDSDSLSKAGAAEELKAVIAFIQRDGFRFHCAADVVAALEKGEHHIFTKEATEKRRSSPKESDSNG